MFDSWVARLTEDLKGLLILNEYHTGLSLYMDRKLLLLDLHAVH